MPVEGTPVFAGAMGWAKYAFHNPPQGYNQNGGYDVTSSADYLPGVESPIEHTLRYAIEQLTGPRNIKVKVNGEINLKTGLTISNQSYVKITGEYATGCGPTITGSEFRIHDCNNIVLRYMRFRSGINAPNHCARSLLIWGEDEGCNDIIVDHCSIGASRDDNFSASGKLCRVTIQNCIIGGGVVGLSKAGIGSGGDTQHQHEQLTYCRNLITNTRERQLAFSGPGRVDFFNNVVSVQIKALEVFAGDGTHAPKMNIIKNHFQTPNAYARGMYFEDPIRTMVVNSPFTQDGTKPWLPKSTNEESLHLNGNIFSRYDVTAKAYQEPYSNQWDMTYDHFNNAGHSNPPPGEANFPTVIQKSAAWDMPSDTILAAGDVLDHVLDNAGCRLPLADPELDEYDEILREAAGAGDRLFPDIESDNNGYPGIPLLVSPTHEATGVSTTVTLTWNESDETDDYVVYLGTSTPLTSPTSSTADTQWQATNLQSNTQYYWRVVARDSCDHTSGSEVRMFTTE